MPDAPNPDGLDVTVFPHLRGFPDELRRFGNIVKQAHGRSAVEFFLSRPAPAESFLAALPPPLWGTGRHRLWRRGEMLRYGARAELTIPTTGADGG